MDIITKAFWDELHKTYEIDVEYFYNWIDKYKKTIGWNALYRPLTSGGARGFSYPKFHDMPTAIQFGIFLQFVSEKGHTETVQLPLTKKGMADFVANYFFHRHYNATKEQIILQAHLKDATVTRKLI